MKIYSNRTLRLLGQAFAIVAVVALAVPAVADDDDHDCEGPKALALVNGKIHMMDKGDSVVSSALIADGKFLAVGGDHYRAGPCTEVVDLHRRTVVPGIIDNHNHIILLGLRPGNDVRLDKANSIQDVLDLLAAKAAEVGPGKWIVSLGGFSTNQFGGEFPTLEQLSIALPNNPVLLFVSFAGPSQTNLMGKTFFMSKGIQVGPPPGEEGGEIDAGAIGTGFGPGSASLTALHELRALPEHNNLAAQKRGLLDALNFGASVGVTTHLDQGSFHYVDSYFGNPGTPDDFFASVLASFDQYRAFDSVRALHGEDALTARIQINYLHQDTSSDTPTLRQRLLNTVPFLGDRWLSNGGIGEFTSRNPFSGSADLSDIGQAATRLVAQHGWRNENHSLGRSDFADIFDMWEDVNDELVDPGLPQPIGENVVNPDGITNLRWVLAHVPFIDTPNIERAKQLGVGLSTLGCWRWLNGSRGSNGEPAGPPFKLIEQLGARQGMSSDGMQISCMDPWTNLYYVVTGKNALGEDINSEQTLGRAEALRLYTSNNAWFLGPRWEKHIGTIEKGKWADLVVLSDDFFDDNKVPDERIRDIHSVLTIVNGKIVHGDPDKLSRRFRKSRKKHRDDHDRDRRGGGDDDD